MAAQHKAYDNRDYTHLICLIGALGKVLSAVFVITLKSCCLFEKARLE